MHIKLLFYDKFFLKILVIKFHTFKLPFLTLTTYKLVADLSNNPTLSKFS